MSSILHSCNVKMQICITRPQCVKRDEVTGDWRKLHNEELNDYYSLLHIMQMVKMRGMRWAGHVVHMEERRDAYRVLMGKPEEKRPLGRLRHTWEDNIKMDLQEVGWGHGLDLSGSGYGQVAGTCECCNEHLSSIRCREFLD